MLSEIICDKFISDNKVRGPISFHKGLNVVQGHNTGTNSIGKSTFLLVIDFVFGGNTYAEDKRIIDKIGHHFINFKFIFDNENYYFSRGTENPKEVCMCDENYNIIKPISIDDFTKKLFDLYNIELKAISFRKVVGLFFRIYGRNNSDEKLALASYRGEGQEESLKNFLKLFNRFESIAKRNSEISEKNKEKSAYKTASNYELVKLLTKKTDYKNNIDKIEEYKNILENYNRKAKEEINNKDSEELKLAAEYKAQCESLKRKKKFLWSKYFTIKDNANLKRPSTTQDFDNLKKFFPNSNIKLISDIDNFHSQLSKILNEEFNESMSNLLKEINSISTEIDKIERIMFDLDLPIKIAKKTLEDYAEIKNKCKTLEKENKLYEDKKQIDTDLKEMKASYEKLFLEQSESLCKRLNEKIKELNDIIYGEEIESPALTIKKHNSYTYGTKDDGGTGTNNKNMILLDLASLSLTQLPCVAHDTILFKQIEQPSIAKILEIYNGYEKQIFIAIDETIKYPETAQKIIKNNIILELSNNGNELYGSSWAKRIIEKTEKK